MIELQHIIESKREVLKRETYSRTPINYSEGMADDQKDRFIQYLAEQHWGDELTKKAMELVLEDFMTTQKLVDEKLAAKEARQSDLEGQLAEERKMRKAAERKAKSLQEKFDYVNQGRFGDRRQTVRKRRLPENWKSRNLTVKMRKTGLMEQKTKGHPEVVIKFEGTKATSEFLQALAYEVYVKNVTFGLLYQWLTDMGMSVSSNTLHNRLEKDFIMNCDGTWCKVRKYDHYKKCYIWMLVNKAQKLAVFFYEKVSRGRDVLTDFLSDAELKNIMSDGYNAYVFIGDELKSAQFKDTLHQVCLSHTYNKFVKTVNQGNESGAVFFVSDLGEFFANDCRYNEADLTPEQRLRERQSLATKEILIRIRSRLDSELAKDPELRSQYYTEADYPAEQFASLW